MHLSPASKSTFALLCALLSMGVDAAGQTATTTSIASSVNPSAFGQLIALTATVAPGAATGNVTFYDNVTVLGTSPIANGSAILNIALLGQGFHVIYARYPGNASNVASASGYLFQTVNAVTQSGFASPASSAVGSGPNSIVVSDFNGDGIPDLATANSSGSVSVLLGNGNETFQPGLDFPLGSSAQSLALADFNGDGKMDLVTATPANSSVSIFLGNGAGRFQATGSFAAGGSSQSVAVGDFNGDGNADIVTANTNNSNVGILLGNGVGAFQPVVTYTTGTNPYAVAVGDFNGDGDADLVVANAAGNNVSVLLGNGDGTFKPAVNYNTGNGPQFLVVGDFNGDGKPDVAVVNYASNNVGVLLGNGDGTFKGVVTYPVDATPSSIVIGDFNGDGDPDLAVGSVTGFNVSVLIGNGDGTFQAYVPYSAGSSPAAVTVGTFGSGGADIAVANATSGTVSVLRALVTAASQTIAFGALSNVVFGASFVVSATASSGLPVGFTSTTPAVCTVSTATVTAVGAGTCSILASQAGNANFLAAPSVAQSFTVTQASQTIAFGALGSVTFGIAPFTVAATATSGLSVSFTSTTPTVCTVSGTTVTVIGTGTCSVTGGQAGNGNFLAAASVVQSFSIVPSISAGDDFWQLAVFRNGTWFLDAASPTTYAYSTDLAFVKARNFGQTGDIPVAGDFDGSGVIRIGVFRPSSGAWYIDANNSGTWDGVNGGDKAINFGLAGDIPVVGDWTGSGSSKIGVFRCSAVTSQCTFILDSQGVAWTTGNYDPTTAVTIQYGSQGDIPIIDNWHGGGVIGVDNVGVFRCPQTSPASACLWIVDSLGLGAYSPADAVYTYGQTGDKPLVGNWFGSIGNQRRIGVYRNGQVILNTSGTNAFSGSDYIASPSGFGIATDLPVIGYWTLP